MCDTCYRIDNGLPLDSCPAGVTNEWTCYIGYYDDHESLSADFARTFLEENGVDNGDIQLIIDAIMATKVPQNPDSEISKVLCDADLMHLSSKEYFDSVEPMRKEWKLSGRSDLSELEFHMQSVNFFEKHRYHTEYGREVLEKLKMNNLNLIRQKIAELSE